MRNDNTPPHDAPEPKHSEGDVESNSSVKPLRNRETAAVVAARAATRTKAHGRRNHTYLYIYIHVEDISRTCSKNGELQQCGSCRSNGTTYNR